MIKKETKKEKISKLNLIFSDVEVPLTEEILEEAHKLKFYETLKNVNPANLDILARYETLKVYSKSKPPKKVKVKGNSWIEISNEDDKKSFQHIVHVLCRYYDLKPPASYPTDAHKFRQDIVKATAENLKVYTKKFGVYEFLVVCEVRYPENEGNTVIDSWIHIDGIVQEREVCKERGTLNHPVFKIVSLSDIFGRGTPVTEATTSILKSLTKD